MDSVTVNITLVHTRLITGSNPQLFVPHLPRPLPLFHPRPLLPILPWPTIPSLASTTTHSSLLQLPFLWLLPLLLPWLLLLRFLWLIPLTIPCLLLSFPWLLTTPSLAYSDSHSTKNRSCKFINTNICCLSYHGRLKNMMK